MVKTGEECIEYCVILLGYVNIKQGHFKIWISQVRYPVLDDTLQTNKECLNGNFFSF